MMRNSTINSSIVCQSQFDDEVSTESSFSEKSTSTESTSSDIEEPNLQPSDTDSGNESDTSSFKTASLNDNSENLTYVPKVESRFVNDADTEPVVPTIPRRYPDRHRKRPDQYTAAETFTTSHKPTLQKAFKATTAELSASEESVLTEIESLVEIKKHLQTS